jgi:hypothetical protein
MLVATEARKQRDHQDDNWDTHRQSRFFAHQAAYIEHFATVRNVRE